MVRLLAVLSCICLGSVTLAEQQLKSSTPNIVLIYADDIGYGDLGCYGATAVATPHCDRVAAAGLKFTDAHCAAATCTPSRYSLLTGEYAFRQKNAKILPGNAPLLIEPGRPTLPALLQKAGYTTGVVGKWHLGLGDKSLDWNGDVKPGPLEIGFDDCFLIPATGDRVPTVYVENHRVVGLDPNDPITVSYGKQIGDAPSGKQRPDLLKMGLTHGHDNTIVNGISRIGFMTGGEKARWVDEEMADDITAKAVEFIEKHKAEPFFLYFPTHDIHVPRVPHPRFVGSTTMGPRGDAIAQFDWCVGQVLDALDRHELANNTLVMITSDNGPVLDDGYADQAVQRVGDHQPAGPYRGGKYSVYEGGTRMPFLARWPNRIEPGTSDAIISQVDLLASLAALVDVKVPQDAAPDSKNLLPALLGESRSGRDELVEQANVLGLRQGNWKYIPRGTKANSQAKPFDTSGPQAELYDLASDPGERSNVIAKHPEQAEAMAERLQAIQAQ